MAEVRDQITELKELASHRLKLPSSVIPVSSADGLQGIAGLLDTLGRLLGDGQSLSMIGEHIPTTYDTLCNLVYATRDQSPDMTWEQFLDLGMQAGMADQQELLRATEFLHDLGIVWHKRDYEMLRETVFLSLTWLNDVLKAIWRHDHDEALTFEAVTNLNSPSDAVGEAESKAAELSMDLETFTRDKQSFLRTGVLSVALLDRLWAHLQLSDRTMAALIRMLERFGLVVMLNADRKRPARMLVPSFLDQQLSSRHWVKSCPAATVCARRWLLFGSNFCPNGLVQRVQVELYPLASGYHFTSDGGVFKLGASKLLVKLLDWEGKKGLQLEIRAPKGQRTERKMWWQLAKVEEAVQTVMRRWRGLLVTPMVPWSAADSAAASGRGEATGEEGKSEEASKKVVLLSFEELLDARRWGKHEMKVPSSGEGMSIGALADVVPLEKVLGPADIGEELAKAKAKERRRARKNGDRRARKAKDSRKAEAASSNQVPSTANSPESSQPGTQRDPATAAVAKEEALEKQWESAKNTGAIAFAAGGDDEDGDEYDFDFSTQKRKLLDARNIDVAVEEAEHAEQTRRQAEERREWEEEHRQKLLDSVRVARAGGEADDPSKQPGDSLDDVTNENAGTDGFGMDTVSHELVIKAELVGGEKGAEDGVIQPVVQKKVRLHSDCSLASLKRKLHKKLGSKTQKASKMALIYRDEDGDKVTIDSELLWQEAAQMACSSSAYSLHVEVHY